MTPPAARTLRTCIASSPGARSSSSATAPLTCAVAYDDPVTKPQVRPGVVVGISRPGASRTPARPLFGGWAATASTPGQRRGEAAVTEGRIDGADDDDAVRDGHIEQPFEQPVVRTAQAEIDHLDFLLQGELQRLGKGEARAGRGGVARALPARSQPVEQGIGRDAGDADAVVRACRDDPGDRRAMRLAGAGWTVDEIARQRHAPAQVRVVGLDTGVHLGDPHVPARRDPVHFGEMPLGRAGLQREERVVVTENVEPFMACADSTRESRASSPDDAAVDTRSGHLA